MTKPYERKTIYDRDRVVEGNQYAFAWRKVRTRTISVGQAATRIGCSADTVRRMVKSGELLGVPQREGVKYSPVRVLLDSVEDYMAKQLKEFGYSDADIKALSSGLPQPSQGSRR